jgi:FlaG/FlaF family flagellin (archaellin)
LTCDLSKNQRRGVDTIVATVLVVAVALAASLAVSGFVFGVTGHAQNSAQVGVTGSALLAADFKSASSTKTFTCASSSPGSYVAITNTGTLGSSVTAVSITWAGTNAAYTPSGACEIGATGSATASMYLNFPATTLIAPGAMAGQSYTGTVTLSNGAQLLLTGTWQ